MSYFSDVLLPFGQRPDGRLVLVSAVDRGAACDCVCPQCAAPLLAKKGDILVHHFAHQGDGSGCGGGALETSLHKVAKQIIADHGYVLAPSLIARINTREGYEIRSKTIINQTNIGGLIEVEAAVGDVRPDVLLTSDTGGRTAIEVYVSHAVGAEKRGKLKDLCLNTIEIDLSGYPRSFDMAALTEFVLEKAYRVWLHHNDHASAIMELRESYRLEMEQEAARRQEEEMEHRRRLAAHYAAQRRPDQYPDYHQTIPQEQMVAGLLKASKTRPQWWPGDTAYPSPDSFCGTCNGREFIPYPAMGGGWGCKGCLQFAAWAA